ncbi:hypothetical protein AVEN_145223-1 [Araneus ventricosus]|uniref:DDE-1 domain-containing protein n=1 Tax=Araneus ventricosus TaxID=182803 RepID=A0A4Y2L924_ARAVE|nr:hypothetical protein AVEN_145223-1 [Araneus ventricosus]
MKILPNFESGYISHSPLSADFGGHCRRTCQPLRLQAIKRYFLLVIFNIQDVYGQVGSLICDAWNKSATVGNATRGFKVAGIFPFKNNALPDQFFFALADSEEPVPGSTARTVEANSSSEVLINTPQINLQPAGPGTSSVKPSSPTKHLHKISPIPRLSRVTAKHRIKKAAVLLTSTGNRNALKENLEK